MWRVTLRGLLAHKLRLALTAVAIVLGVTFVSGAFVLTDTLHNTFSTLLGNVYSKIDFEVRGVSQLPTSAANATRNPIPESLLARVRAVPGVEAAYGEAEGYAQFVSRSGHAISNGSAATLALEFDPNPRISNLHLIHGRPPSTSDDVVMDAGTASSYHFHVGQRVRVLSQLGPHTYTITGIAEFGNSANLAGDTIAAFTLPTVQRLVGEVGRLDAINVVSRPGADKPAVQRAIARVLPRGVQVVTGATIVAEETSAVNQGLSFLSTALLVFALISLFVGAFTIFNTFSIIVGQRTRELALLRVLGASRGQVLRSVLAESALVGAASSLVGLGLGVLAALGLEALLRGFGISLPSGPLVFQARTVVVSLAVGVGVTTVVAIGPARRAVAIPPVAALTDRPAEGEGASSRRRLVSGLSVLVGGAVLIGVGLGASVVALAGLGAAAVFVGATMLAPAIARPLSGAIGRPLAGAVGMPGRLGRENTMRNPSRTAQTASALMVGVALVSAIAVFGASASRSATASVDQAINADLLITGSSTLSNSMPGLAARVPGVTASTVVYRSQFEFRHSLATLTAGPGRGLAATVHLRMTAGTAAALGRGQLLVDATTAKSDHLSVGDVVPVRFAFTGPTTLRIGGLYRPNALIGSYLVSDRYFLAHFDDPAPAGVLLRTTGTAANARVRAALARFPNLTIQTKQHFEHTEVASVNQLLGLIYALLALAVLVALIGIANTLMLSIFERTREIGLLRAVGMRRAQVRSMVRSESVILALFGAVTGIVIGTGLGLAMVSALHSQGITDTAVPVTSLVLFLVLSGVLGVVAAGWPARRASHLDILAALTPE